MKLSKKSIKKSRGRNICCAKSFLKILREIKSNEKCLYKIENVLKALKKAGKEHMPGDIEKNGNVT